MNIPKDQFNSIVARTMKEADLDQDGFITFDEFKKVLKLCQKLYIYVGLKVFCVE